MAIWAAILPSRTCCCTASGNNSTSARRRATHVVLRPKRRASSSIEQLSRLGVTGHAGVSWAPRDVRVANPAFDVTPARLVTALITEKGVVMKPTRAKLRALMSDARR